MIFHLFHKWHNIEVTEKLFRICEKCGKVEWYGGYNLWPVEGEKKKMIQLAFKIHKEDPEYFMPSSESKERREIEKIRTAVINLKEVIKQMKEDEQENKKGIENGQEETK